MLWVYVNSITRSTMYKEYMNFFLNCTTLSSHHPLIADQVLSLNQNIWTTKYHSDLLKGVLLDKGR